MVAKYAVHQGYVCCSPEPKYNLTMYNYGGPRVGNMAFNELYKVKDSWRVHNENDIVAQIPVAGTNSALPPQRFSSANTFLRGV